MKFNVGARLTAEFVGSAFLVAAVVGSGIMGERLAGGNVAIALLANTIATGAALVALILTFGPISGAHLNPAVTLADGARYSVARSDGVHECAMHGRDRGSDHRASDVWSALVFRLHTSPAWVGAGSKRVRGNVRATVGDLGLLAPAFGSGAVCRSELHHRRLLVHRVNFVCKPSSNNCPLLV